MMMTDISRRDIVAARRRSRSRASRARRSRNRAARQPPKQNAVKLECAFKDMVIDGTKVRLRLQRARYGPPMKIFPGQRLHINLKNSLPPYDIDRLERRPQCAAPSRSRQSACARIERHPHRSSRSEPPTAAPMIEIMPGDNKDMCSSIPADHPPGLNWYHPHHQARPRCRR
jgi:hypothetical protein